MRRRATSHPNHEKEPALPHDPSIVFTLTSRLAGKVARSAGWGRGSSPFCPLPQIQGPATETEAPGTPTDGCRPTPGW